MVVLGGKVCRAPTPVVEEKDILEAVMRASSADTAALESYHAELNRNAPKMSYFSYSGMQSRYVDHKCVALFDHLYRDICW